MSQLRVPILISVCLLLIVSCSNELPPEPGEIGEGTTASAGGIATGQASYTYQEGYAPPIDVDDNDRQIFFLDEYIFNMNPDESQLQTGVLVNHPDGLVYKYYYVFVNGEWEKRVFNEDTYKSSNWIQGQATDWMSVDTPGLAIGENYVVAYSCKKYNNQWKCGCGDYNCNQWMLNSFLYRNVDLPPEPIEPGSVITQRIWISPSGQIIPKGQSTNLDVYFSSRREDLEELGDTIKVIITKETTGEEVLGEIITLERTSDPHCHVDESSFDCHISYYGELTTLFSEFGEYSIEMAEATPETTKVESGYFKVVPESFLDNFIIASNIGAFEYQDQSGYYGSDETQYINARYRSEDTRAYVDISFPREEIYVSDFTDRGDGVYFRFTPDEERGDSHLSIRWLSGPHAVEIDFYGSGEESEQIMLNTQESEQIIEAYLAKHPLDTKSILKGYPENIITPDNITFNVSLTSTNATRFNTTFDTTQIPDGKYNISIS